MERSWITEYIVEHGKHTGTGLCFSHIKEQELGCRLTFLHLLCCVEMAAVATTILSTVQVAE